MSTEVFPEGELDRWVQMEGCANFRDAGGYPTADGQRVRTRRLYRSASPARMTERDTLVARDELGIRTVIDVRAEEEGRVGGYAPFADGSVVRLVTMPMGRGIAGGADGLPDISATLGPLYVLSAQREGTRIAEVVQTIASACDDPLVVHCAGGKDRTGVIIALILDVLGVSDELIVEDYALTELSLDRIPAEHLAAMAKQVGEHGWPEAILHAIPDSMRIFLAWLREEHGTAAEFLSQHDGGPAAVTALRAKLLESPVAPK